MIRRLHALINDVQCEYGGTIEEIVLSPRAYGQALKESGIATLRLLDEEMNLTKEFKFLGVTIRRAHLEIPDEVTQFCFNLGSAVGATNRSVVQEYLSEIGVDEQLINDLRRIGSEIHKAMIQIPAGEQDE